MARKSEWSLLVLTQEQRCMLQELCATRVAPTREVERAKVMLGYADGISITELQRRLGFSRPMIYRCVDKALAAGVQMGLKDKYHRPHEPEITGEAKAWVVSIACTKPKDQGLAAELWSILALAQFVCEHAQAAGFPAWPMRARAPFGGSWTATTSSRTKFAITCKSETPTLTARCRKF